MNATIRNSAALVVVVLVLALLCQACFAQNPCKWVLYKQCDSHWGNIRLGTSSRTICQAGCAMTSVAMALATHDFKIGRQTTTPGTLDAWLTAHGGYVDGDLLVWGSVSGLGPVKMVDSSSSLSPQQLNDYVSKCYAVVANVRDGTHWVLVTAATDKSLGNWYVNDPGFNQATYEFDSMSHWIVYQFA